MSTTNHGLTLPVIGADASTWGGKLNDSLTQLENRAPSLTGKKVDGTTDHPFTGAQAFAVGSASAPGLYFTGDSNSGFYWIAADSIGLTLGGTLRGTFATTGLTLTGGLSAGGALSATTGTFTGLVLTAASAAGGAGLRVPHGSAPTSPANGDIWTTTSGVFARVAGVNRQLDTTTGNWGTPRDLSLTGDVTATLDDVDGSGNVSAAATIANNAVTTAKIANNNVTLAKLATQGQSTFLGRTAGGAASDAPAVLSAAQAAAIVNSSIDLSSAAIGTGGAFSNYYKIGPIYVMFGTSTSSTSDGNVIVSAPVSFTTLLWAGAIGRNTGAAGSVNNEVQWVASDGGAPNVTFYQNTHGSGAAPQGFNWIAFVV